MSARALAEAFGHDDVDDEALEIIAALEAKGYTLTRSKLE